MQPTSPRLKAFLCVGVVLSLLVSLGSFAGAQTCVQPPADLVSWWPGDGNANDIQDGNNGTLEGGATFDSGLVGQAFRFNASLNSGVRIASSESLNPADAITLDAWVFPFSFPNGAPSILRREGNAGSTQYLIAVGDGTIAGVAHCNIGDFAGGTGGVVALRQWTHVACTYDREFVRLYVNGVEVATKAATQLIPAVSHELWIGNHERFIRQFDGLIDEVELFNRALSADEIQAIFNAGSAGKCKDDDGDGISDADDNCPGTPEDEIVNENGCSIDQLCPCENNWENHGAYVSCVTQAAEDFVAEGLITEAEKDAIVSAAAESDCGSKK